MSQQLRRVRAVLASTPARWAALANDVDADLIARAPAPGEWSAFDCLEHLLETERDVFPVRLDAFLAGRDFPGFDPDAEGPKTPAGDARGLAAELGRLRAANLQSFDRLTAEDLGRTAMHAELGRVSLAEMLDEWAGHDLMHTVQAERALMQVFITGCGPWRVYFEDHDAGAKD